MFCKRKGYVPNWSEEVFVINKIINTVSWRYVIRDLKVEEIIDVLRKRITKSRSKNG